MAFALLIAGAFLLIASVKGTQDTLYTNLTHDFTGSGNFVYWLVAMLAIGALGYVPKLKPLSVGLLALVILVLFLRKGDPSGVGGGFFSQLTAGLGSTANPKAATPAATATTTAPTGILGAVGSLSTIFHAMGVP